MPTRSNLVEKIINLYTNNLRFEISWHLESVCEKNLTHPYSLDYRLYYKIKYIKNLR